MLADKVTAPVILAKEAPVPEESDAGNFLLETK
jgi:hypothetical protein